MLLFLHKSDFVVPSVKVHVEEQLELMKDKIENFKGYF